MLEPGAVSALLRLKELGFGTRRIARTLGISRNTVKGYIEAGGWRPYKQPWRRKRLDGHESWLRERFERHRGNADVVRQELLAEKGLVVSLRTIERAVAPYRRALAAQARATMRFETGPGQQMQIDFGERLVELAGAKVKVFLFVATLGYSRRLHVRAFRNERQESWFAGLESAFAAFSGVTEEVLFDNARALVIDHDAVTRSVVFNDKLVAFAKHWGFRPRACAPYRARTKGKTENGVGYVKKNAIAGRGFESWEALEAHLDAWTREVAEVRIHGTTGEAPHARFARAEAAALKPIAGILPFRTTRELIRHVSSDCTVELDGNAYSVPWRLIGESVRVTVTDTVVRVHHGAREVAVHAVASGRRQRIVDPGHYAGIAGAAHRAVAAAPASELPPAEAASLLRPLGEYEALIGGGF
jgi:transposase